MFPYHSVLVEEVINDIDILIFPTTNTIDNAVAPSRPTVAEAGEKRKSPYGYINLLLPFSDIRHRSIGRA